jgi:ABC-type nitrate/sulfonate/bicarbonate transport system permease component
VFERFGQVWFRAGFVQHVLPSLSNLALGFLIALVLGIAIGTLLALLPTLDLLLDPFLQFFRALPSIALLPLLMMLLGTSDVSKIALIAYGAFWPILLNTVDGIKAIPPELRQTARSYRLTPYCYLTRVLMPGAYPQASIGIRLSLSIALVLMVGSELYGSSRGIGYFVIDAKNRFFVADMWAGVILLGIIGYLISIGYNALERRMLRWREAAR